MKYGIFSVRDSVAQAFLPPFVLPQQGQAVRSFTQAINDPDHVWNKSPEDFNLHKLGVFDDDDGSIIYDENTPIVLKGLQAIGGQAALQEVAS